MSLSMFQPYAFYNVSMVAGAPPPITANVPLVIQDLDVKKVQFKTDEPLE